MKLPTYLYLSSGANFFIYDEYDRKYYLIADMTGCSVCKRFCVCAYRHDEAAICVTCAMDKLVDGRKGKDARA